MAARRKYINRPNVYWEDKVVTLGVTGGLGSGKSTACHFLEKMGATVFDADRVAKGILLAEKDIQERLIEAFGNAAVSDGKIDTGKLAQVAFSNEENQTVLNDIIHPRVIEAFAQLAGEKRDEVGLLAVDAPLIFESGFDNHLDHTLLIYTRFKIRMNRAMRRGTLSREDILRRIALQMPEEEKRELASYVIENNGDVEQLRQSLEELYQELQG